jgi:geranylgeranyl diphosphate synthase type I
VTPARSSEVPPDATPRSKALDEARRLVEPVLDRALLEARRDLVDLHPHAAMLVDELRRVVAAGGKRIRPALCVWAFRASRGVGDDVVARAAAALELLHTFAIVHDDVMDRGDERRGVPATHVRFAKDAPPGADPDAFGVAMAILAGDLAAVLAERSLRTCGGPKDRVDAALDRFDAMRTAMAAGQLLDLSSPLAASAPRAAELKTGSYTGEGPVRVGAALAGATPAADEALTRFGRSVGEAFQVRDDLLDGEADDAAPGRLDALLDEAILALDDASLDPRGRSALAELAALLRLPAGERGGGG